MRPLQRPSLFHGEAADLQLPLPETWQRHQLFMAMPASSQRKLTNHLNHPSTQVQCLEIPSK